ncbi:hypothetical protein BY996DRAFT_4577068, partial [Phakopsora pachyrhizi]
EPDERTPLIIQEPQPTPTPQPQIDTQRLLADEAAAHSIVDTTVRHLVQVYSQTPFSHLRVQDSTPTTDHTPDSSSRSSWRAYDPPLCPSLSPTIQRLRLGFDEPRESLKAETGGHATGHKKSFHSLKTIVKDSDGTPRDTSSLSHEARPNGLAPTVSDCEEVENYSRDSCLTPSSQFNTIRTDATFQTAVEDNGSIREVDGEPEPIQTDYPRTNGQPEFVGNLWQESSFKVQDSLFSESESTEPSYLTDDPQKLNEMVSAGFKLCDTGPILVDL